MNRSNRRPEMESGSECHALPWDLQQADKMTAFAWSDNRSEAATFPLAANFSHNPSGGTISGGYSESGEYSIQFTDLNAESGNGRGGQYQVTAYGVEGISIRAKLSGILFGGGVTPLVRGMNLAGESVPSSFTLLATWPDGDANAYVWADQAEEASYTPNLDFAYNPSGGGITVTRSSVGVYTVMFEDYTLDGGNVQVTPWSWVDTTATVNVVSWYNFQGNLEVEIRAYDAAGNPSDAVFSLLATNRP